MTEQEGYERTAVCALPEADRRRAVFGQRFGELAVMSEERLALGEIEHDAAAEHGRDRVETIRELCQDAEVSAAAAKRPEQVDVVRVAHVKRAAIGGDHARRDEVVARETVLPHEPANAATECQSRDAGRRDDTSWDGETESRRRAIQLAPGDAGIDPGNPRPLIDANTLHG